MIRFKVKCKVEEQLGWGNSVGLSAKSKVRMR